MKRILSALTAAFVLALAGMGVGAATASAADIGGVCAHSVNVVDCVSVSGGTNVNHDWYASGWHEQSLGLTTNSEASAAICDWAYGSSVFIFFAAAGGTNVYGTSSTVTGPWSSATSIGALPATGTNLSCAEDGSTLYVFASTGGSGLYQNTWTPGSGWTGWGLVFTL